MSDAGDILGDTLGEDELELVLRRLTVDDRLHMRGTPARVPRRSVHADSCQLK